MVNPDNTKIRIHYGDEGDLGRDGEEVKPVEAVKSTKDFKKVLSKRAKESRDQVDDPKKKPSKVFDPTDKDESDLAFQKVDTNKDDEENAAAAGPASLFDLSKSQNSQIEGLSDDKAGKEIKKVAPPTESPQDLFRRMSTSKTTPKKFPSETELRAKEDASRYAREQPDLSYVNPLGVHNIAGAQAVEEKKQPAEGVQLIDVINQVIKQLYTIETKGQTDTVFVLQYPPLFEGVTVVVSAFDTAKGQFNIAFQNLTQEAQRILDMAENRQMLIAGLAEKGYGVQIMTTTTQAETNPIITEEPSKKRDQDEESRREGRRQQGRGQ